jgi:hypothetical protein
MRLLILLAMMILGTTAAEAAKHRFVEGQVWSYHTRPQDRGSLLRIWKIERGSDGERVFHISVIGLSAPKGKAPFPEIEHLPLTEAALDESVVARVQSDAVFPNPSTGYASWRKSGGGPFTMTVAEVVELVAKSIATGTTTR